MAGEAILANIVTEILKKLGSLALEEINLARGVKKELEKLKETILMIEAVISDAENKQVKEKSVGIWLKKLKDLAYEADDILDEYAYDVMHQRQGLNRKSFDQVRRIMSKNSNPIARYLKRGKMGHEIKNFNQKFDDLARQRDALGLERVNVGSFNGSHGINRETYAFVDESKILGREDDKSKIINMLLANKSSSCNQNDKISVIPILGMGGLGKTALAQLVYKDNVVENHFELRIWVCVSDVFDLKKIFINIIESITCTKFDGGSDLNFIVNTLQQHLGGRRFLLVLDDVWNEKDGEWNKLKEPLVVGAEGSKILVTTRSEKVACIVLTGEFPFYKLQTLGDDICLSIFEQRAFGPSCKAIKTSTLVEIGKELVRKCGGLPLAAEALGSLMHSMKEVREWEVIRDNEIWDNNPENRNKILPALKLSYDHLSPQVKQCFSYCSMFPKDSVIKRETLIRLWVAEGFIQPFEGDERLMEEIGNGYFNNLLWNSFFQGVSTNEDGEITEFKMHDLIHDLAQSVAGTHECSFMEAGEMGDISKFRRLNLLNVNEESSAATATATVFSKSKLRTLFIQDGRIKNIANYGRLRVLDLSDSDIEELPPSIGDLKHLRYLDLSHCWKLKNLPDSFTRLCNLQTLLLDGCFELTKYPKDLNKLINLRHLSHGVRDWQDQVGQLTCLQNLKGGNLEGEEIGELQFLNLLGGKLEITGLERVRGRENAESANLIEKKYIQQLSLRWSYSRFEEGGVEVREDEYSNDGLVLEGLQPHPNLRTLKIFGFMGLKFPTWMSSNLQNLVHLQLRSCNRCEQLPALGVLPSLRILGISRMLHLEEWLDQPLPLSLERIEISGCPKLKSMPTKFFSLKEIDVWGTSNGMDVSSIVRSNLDTLTKLSLWDVDGLKFLPQGLLKGNNVLESLEISDCPDFKGFNREEEEGDEDLILLSSSSSRSSLYTLELRNCPNLTLLPGDLLRYLTSLRTLEVYNCERIELCPILKSMVTGFPSMKELILKNDNGIKIQRSLQGSYLEISNTPGLVFLPLGLLKGNNVLERLVIINCPDFKGFNREEEGDEESSSSINNSLHTLKLHNCPNLTLLLGNLRGFTSLHTLCLDNCPNLTLLLGDLLRDLTSLHTLELGNCPNLTLLPGNLRGFTSLHTLCLDNCPNLTLLPGDLLRDLTSLRTLEVYNCERIEMWPILKSMLTGFPSMEKLILENDNGIENDNGLHIMKVDGTYLRIKNTPGLMFLPLGLLKGNNVLENLSISNCPDFQGFIQEEEECDEDLSVLCSSSNRCSRSSLRVLYLRDCPVLRLLPDLKELTSLQFVTIQGCNEDLVISLPNGVENLDEVVW